MHYAETVLVEYAFLHCMPSTMLRLAWCNHVSESPSLNRVLRQCAHHKMSMKALS